MKIDWDNVMVWIIAFFLLCIIVFFITLKIGGGLTYFNEPEKMGYCKLKYGSDFTYSEGSNTCRFGNESYLVTFEDFSEICSEHKWWHKGFFSECFNAR